MFHVSMTAAAATAILAFFATTSSAIPSLKAARNLHSFVVPANQTNVTVPHGSHNGPHHAFHNYPPNKPYVLEDGTTKRVLMWEPVQKRSATKPGESKIAKRGPPNYDVVGTHPEFPEDIIILTDPKMADMEFQLDCRDYGPPIDRSGEINAIDHFCKKAAGTKIDEHKALKYINYNRDDNMDEGPWTAEYTVVAKAGNYWVLDENTCGHMFRKILDECDIEGTAAKQGGVMETPQLMLKINNTMSYEMPEAPDCWHWRDPGCPGEGFPADWPNFAAYPMDFGDPDGGKDTPFHYPTIEEEKKYNDGWVWPGCEIGLPFDLDCLNGRERSGRPRRHG